jgi:methylmalonyl-CoA mutase cobalamin-binding domain/chain
MGDGMEASATITNLKQAILNGDYESASAVTKEALEAGIEAETIMKKAITEGIAELEKGLFGGDKVWLHPVFLLGMEGVRQSLEVLEPYFSPKGEVALGRVVLGTSAGDTHDLGAKMVALALRAAGFEVVYLGRDVPLNRFVDACRETDVDVLAISSYQTTGFVCIEEILRMMDAAHLREKTKVMIGGSVITERFAEKMNVGYARNASDAVKLAHEYIRG